MAHAQVDGRGFERVSPRDKNGGDIVRAPAIEADGDAAAMLSLTARDDAAGLLSAAVTVSRRTATGWTTTDANMGTSHASLQVGAAAPVGIAASLQRIVLESTGAHDAADTDPYAPDLFATDVGTGSIDWLTHGASLPDAAPVLAHFLGGSSELDRVVFMIRGDDPLTSDAPHTDSIYVRDADGLRLVSVRPDDSPALASDAGLPGQRGINDPHRSGAPVPGGGMHAVSRDGRRVYFYDMLNAVTGGPLLLRDDDQTYAVSASHRAGDPADAQDATFLGASPDGRIAYFSSDAPLTTDAAAGGGMYRYDVQDGSLTLVVPAPDGGGLGLTIGLGSVAQAIVSEDAATVYFVSPRALGGAAQEGAANLYVLRDGVVHFVASPVTLGRVSRDGRFALLTSTASFGGAATGGHTAIYEYDADGGTLACVSCRPDGQPATADASLDEQAPSWLFWGFSPPRNVTDDGRVFFTTREQLVPADNGTGDDVYEYDHGTTSLISPGRGDEGGFLVDNTDDGHDVFFITREQMVADDDDELLDLYDARVGGGFAPASQACEAALCGPGLAQHSSARPVVLSPASTLVTTTSTPGAATTPRRRLVIVSPASGARRAPSRTGRVMVTLRVSGGGTVLVSLRGRLGRHTATLASARKALGGTTTRTLRLSLPLSRAARRALARHGAVKVDLRATLSNGLRRSSSFTLTRHAR